MRRVGIGFDGMCADVSILGLGDRLADIGERWPRLAPLMASLLAGRDEELTCEAEGITPEEFYALAEGLAALPGAKSEVHIGANCALEVATAAMLLSDRVPLVADAAFDYLGFWSPRTVERVPEKIPESALARGRGMADSEAVSLIVPHGGKRVILSFGGRPPVRVLSPELRSYMETEVPRYFAEVKPDLQIVVGTAVTWSAALKEDFDLLTRIIRSARAEGASVLVDLGGLGSWDREALATYFGVIGEADILSMNESELGVYYGQRTGKRPLGTGARELAAMVLEAVRPGQGFLVHTPEFQLAFGLTGPVEEALAFAGKAATLRGTTGVFPTARQVIEADLEPSDRGEAQIEGLPAGFAAVPGFKGIVRNPVGLGDTWTCSFALSYLGGDR